MVRKQTVCRECGETYSPLVYADGKIREAQHFHSDYQELPIGHGGIYHYHRRLEPYASPTWTAILTQVEECLPESVEQNSIVYTSERIMVQEILAKCWFCNTWTEEGALVSVEHIDKNLRPAHLDCIQEEYERGNIGQFLIQEGVPHFNFD